MKLIVADNKMPPRAKQKLSEMGKTIWFETQSIVYPAISGHPDIFMTQVENELIVAPNIPEKYLKIFTAENINYIVGKKNVGKTYPETARFNAMADNCLILHNVRISDEAVQKHSEHLQKVNVKQGYCRCNCISLNSKAYVCSDRGIETALQKAGKQVLYINPDNILLEGYENGFLGGACGVVGNTVVVCGNLSKHPDGQKLRTFIEDNEFHIVELYDGPFADVGGIFFM